MPETNELERFLSQVEKILNGLPKPLVEPLWYPGVPPEPIELPEFLIQLGEFLRALVELVIKALEDEGFFEENPVIRVYPKYGESSGIVVFYKGRKVWEKWVQNFELNTKDPKAVARETAGWYGEMHQGFQNMTEEEREYYLEYEIPPWEREQFR